MKEEWRDIIDYRGLYQVSNKGRVRSLDRIGVNGRHWKGKVLKIGAYKEGYVRIGLWREKRRKTCSMHRLVLTAFDRQPKGGEECNHRDGSKKNNSIHNLEWVTRQENNIHKCRMLKKCIGEKHHNAKLTNKDVREIKDKVRKKGHVLTRVAKRYGVSIGVINGIKRGSGWRHIK